MKKLFILVGLFTVLFATAQPQDTLFVWKSGQLVIKQTERARLSTVHAAWRDSRLSPAGHALLWWIAQLDKPATRQALLGQT